MMNWMKKIGALLITLLVIVGLLGCSPIKMPSISSLLEQSISADESTPESSKTESKPSENSIETSQKEEESSSLTVVEDGKYYSKEEVALYIHLYKHLPSNYLTKKEAQNLGWVSNQGNLWEVTDKMVIGGDRFGNYEEVLPTKKGRSYTECDVNYQGGHRDAQRIVFSNDGLIYFTDDHYNTFELLYSD